jgi:tetratricopeptide (TPR) repeat protein
VNLGVSYSQLDRQDDALEAFRRGVEADSTSVDAWRNLGYTYRSIGEAQAAREAFEKVVDLAPDSFADVFTLGDMYFAEENYQKAMETYARAAEIKDDDPALHYQIGATHFNLESFGEAAMSFQRSAALASEQGDTGLYRDAMHNLGLAYIRNENYDGAISTYERLKAIEDTAEIHELLGAAYSKKGMKEKAMEEFNRADELKGE